MGMEVPTLFNPRAAVVLLTDQFEKTKIKKISTFNQIGWLKENYNEKTRRFVSLGYLRTHGRHKSGSINTRQTCELFRHWLFFIFDVSQWSLCPSESQGAAQRKYRNLFWNAFELDTVSQPIQSSTDDCVSFEKGMIGSPTERIASRPRVQPNFENAKLILFYLRNKNKNREVFF